MGVKFGQPTTVGGTPAGEGVQISQGLVDGAATAFLAMLNTANMNFSTATWFEECRGYRIGRDGKALDEPVISSGLPDAGPGVVFQPWQLTVACTLFTGGLGKGRFGRFYLPSQYTAVGTDGLISTTFQNNISVAVKDFLIAIKGHVDFPGGNQLIVASQTPTEGRNRTVTALRIGRVVDTQRRRRRSLQETYQESIIE